MEPLSRIGPDGAIESPCLQGYEASGKVWPNGEFSCGSKPVYEWVELTGAELQAQLQKESERIGLLNGSKSHIWEGDMFIREPRRGEKGITSHGRKMVKSAALKLEQKYGYRNLSFATVTLPELTDDDATRVTANWSQITRVFFQKLGRRVKAKKGTWNYVAVTEIQPKRFNESAFLGLHVHFVFVGKCYSAWYLSPSDVRECWSSTVQRYCGTGYNWRSCENVVSCKPGVGDYLGKYISKGTTELERAIKENPLAFMPSSWYSLSSGLRKWVLSSVLESSQVVALLFALLVGLNSSGMFIDQKEIYRETRDGPAFVGFYGRLTSSGFDKLRNID